MNKQKLPPDNLPIIVVPDIIQSATQFFGGKFDNFVWNDEWTCAPTGYELWWFKGAKDKKIARVYKEGLRSGGYTFYLQSQKPAKKTEEPLQKPQFFTPNPDDPEEDLRSRLAFLEKKLIFNIRKNCDEIEKDGKKEEINNREKNKLYLDCWTKVFDSKGKIHKIPFAMFEKAFDALLVSNSYDPFKEYLEKLPPFEGELQLHKLLNTLFEVEKGYEELADWAGVSIFLAAVWRTFVPGTKHDEIPLLISQNQGIGKSTMLKTILKDPEWFTDAASLSSDDREFVERTRGRVICESSEMDGISNPKDLGRLKTQAARGTDSTRVVWGKKTENFPRRFIFVGTGNKDECLPDDDENRRFLPVKLKKRLSFKEVTLYIRDNRDRLWAEALWMFKVGRSARLPEELWEKAKKIAEKHRGGDKNAEEWFLEEISNLDEFSLTKIMYDLKEGVYEENDNGNPVLVPGTRNRIPNQGPKLRAKLKSLALKEGFEYRQVNKGESRIRMFVRQEKQA